MMVDDRRHSEWEERMKRYSGPLWAAGLALAAAVLAILPGASAMAEPKKHVQHKAVVKPVARAHVKPAARPRVVKSVKTTKTVKTVTPKTVHRPMTVHKTTKTITKVTPTTKTLTKTVKTGPNVKTLKFASGKTKVVAFSGQKGFKTKPGSFVKPAHIVHNPKHIAGLHGHHHGHKAFFFRHGGHRWHRWYYPLLAGGLWYWYWYDLPADNDPAVVRLADTELPDCDPDDDECIELDE